MEKLARGGVTGEEVVEAGFIGGFIARPLSAEPVLLHSAALSAPPFPGCSALVPSLSSARPAFRPCFCLPLALTGTCSSSFPFLLASRPRRATLSFRRGSELIQLFLS